jgi:hypothetical protein
MLARARSVTTADTAVTCLLVVAVAAAAISYYAVDDALTAMLASSAQQGVPASAVGPVRVALASSLVTVVAVMLPLMAVGRARLADSGWFGPSRVAALAAQRNK